MNSWEIIVSSDDERTERIGVHGGWLYRALSWDPGGTIISQCMAFVPEAGKKSGKGRVSRGRFPVEREAAEMSRAIEGYEDQVSKGEH